MTDTPLKIGIAGLGTVGVGVVKLLSQQADLISQRSGRDIVVTNVSARDSTKDRNINISGINWSNNPLEMAVSPDVDVVIELIGGHSGIAKELVNDLQGACADWRRAASLGNSDAAEMIRKYCY